MGYIAVYLIGLGSGLFVAFTFTALGYRIAQAHATPEDDEA